MKNLQQPLFLPPETFETVSLQSEILRAMFESEIFLSYNEGYCNKLGIFK